MALPTLDATFASSVDLPRKQMLAKWLVNETGSGTIADYYSLPERYLWAKIAVAAGAPRGEADYISLPKNYAWSDIYNAVASDSGSHIDWTEKQALGHIAAAYRGDTANPENLATYISWPWRYQVASIIGSLSIPLSGLVLRLNADFGINESGGVITSWTDQKNSIVATPSGSPVLTTSGANGRKAVLFDGNDDEFYVDLDTAITSDQDRTYVVIGKYTDPLNFGQPGMINGITQAEDIDRGYLFKNSFEQDAYFYFSGAESAGQLGPVTIPVNQYCVQTAVLRADGTGIIRANGTELSGEIAIPDEDVVKLVIGSRGLGAEEFLYGGITEILIYNRELSSSEISQIEAYSGVV